MSPEAWGFLSMAVVAVVTYLFAPPVAAWARHRWGSDISKDASEAVQSATGSRELPIGVDAALIHLARRMQEMDEREAVMERRDAAWAMHTLHLEVWGERGWLKAPEPHDPMPARPPLLRPGEGEG